LILEEPADDFGTQMVLMNSLKDEEIKEHDLEESKKEDESVKPLEELNEDKQHSEEVDSYSTLKRSNNGNFNKRLIS
jgi:hypothetical protein